MVIRWEVVIRREAIRKVPASGHLVTDLEDKAAARGVRVLRLDTNRSRAEAIGLYRSAGYREVSAFNDEPYAHHWFEKVLGGDTPADGGTDSGADQ